MNTTDGGARSPRDTQDAHLATWTLAPDPSQPAIDRLRDDADALATSAATWRGIARAAIDVITQQAMLLDQRQQTIVALRDQLRERMGVRLRKATQEAGQ